jgi:hypothetical protein
MSFNPCSPHRRTGDEIVASVKRFCQTPQSIEHYAANLDFGD